MPDLPKQVREIAAGRAALNWAYTSVSIDDVGAARALTEALAESLEGVVRNLERVEDERVVERAVLSLRPNLRSPDPCGRPSRRSPA